MLVADNDAEGQLIRTVRADDVVRSRVAFIKLDVEGHEISALAGVSRILAEDRPVILTEVNEYWLRKAGKSGLEYLEKLRSHDYATLSVETLEPIDALTETLAILESINVLAVPVESVASVRARIM
jgi:methyltransferase FkbM-like protein